MAEMQYDDGLIACSDDELVIRKYDVFLRPRHVRYRQIRSAREVELRGFRFGMWRIWGSTDLRQWFNMDWSRPKKRTGLVLDLGTSTTPVVSPDDVQRVAEILRSHGVEVAGGPRDA